MRARTLARWAGRLAGVAGFGAAVAFGGLSIAQADEVVPADQTTAVSESEGQATSEDPDTSKWESDPEVARLFTSKWE